MIGVVARESCVVAREFLGDPSASGHEKGCAAWESQPLKLPEHIFHLAEQRAQQWLIVDLREGIELLQQFLLAFAELGRYLDANLDVQIALAVSVQYRHAFVTDAEGGARLCAIRNLQRVLAFHRSEERRVGKECR